MNEEPRTQSVSFWLLLAGAAIVAVAVFFAWSTERGEVPRLANHEAPTYPSDEAFPPPTASKAIEPEEVEAVQPADPADPNRELALPSHADKPELADRQELPRDTAGAPLVGLVGEKVELESVRVTEVVDDGAFYEVVPEGEARGADAARPILVHAPGPTRLTPGTLLRVAGQLETVDRQAPGALSEDERDAVRRAGGAFVAAEQVTVLPAAE